jgi:hypothetical protein
MRATLYQHPSAPVQFDGKPFDPREQDVLGKEPRDPRVHRRQQPGTGRSAEAGREEPARSAVSAARARPPCRG